MRVLIADSNLARLERLYVSYAAQPGIEVCACSSATEVLQQADETPINCFILDEAMFGITGHTLCRILRKIPGYLRTPIYIASGSPTSHQEVHAASVGATEYVHHSELGSIFEVMIEQTEPAATDSVNTDIAGRTCFDDDPAPLPTPHRGPMNVSRKSMLDLFSLLAYPDREASILFSIQIRKRDMIQSVADRPIVRAIGRTIESLAETGKALYAHVGHGCFVILAERDEVGSSKEFGALVDKELRLNAEIGVGLCPIVSSGQVSLDQLTTSAIRAAFWRLADARHPGPKCDEAADQADAAITDLDLTALAS